MLTLSKLIVGLRLAADTCDMCLSFDRNMAGDHKAGVITNDGAPALLFRETTRTYRGQPSLMQSEPIRQLVRGEDKIPRRYPVILPGTPDNHGAAVQVQRE
jgi:hypothetical protein